MGSRRKRVLRTTGGEAVTASKKRGIHADEFRLFHDAGLFLPTRTIYMGSEIVDLVGESGTDARMAERVIKNMHVLESISKDPITIIMNNEGGDEYHGLAMYDVISRSECHVKILVRGHAMSMGSIILQAADERVMSENAVQMIHYGVAGLEHHCKTVWKQAEEMERLNDWMEGLYLGRIREKHQYYDLSELKKLLDHDTFLTAAESVELGLADSIG